MHIYGKVITKPVILYINQGKDPFYVGFSIFYKSKECSYLCHPCDAFGSILIDLRCTCHAVIHSDRVFFELRYSFPGMVPEDTIYHGLQGFPFCTWASRSQTLISISTPGVVHLEESSTEPIRCHTKKTNLDFVVNICQSKFQDKRRNFAYFWRHKM